MLYGLTTFNQLATISNNIAATGQVLERLNDLIARTWNAALSDTFKGEKS